MTIFPDLYIFREKGIAGLHEDGKVETVSYEKPGNMILTQGAEVGKQKYFKNFFLIPTCLLL